MQAAETTLLRAELHDRQAYVFFRPNPMPSDQLFVVDIYSAESNQHPEFHLGWWAWPEAEARHAAGVRFVYHSPEQVDVFLICAEGERAAHKQWVNPNYRLAPLQQMNIVWHDEQ